MESICERCLGKSADLLFASLPFPKQNLSRPLSRVDFCWKGQRRFVVSCGSETLSITQKDFPGEMTKEVKLWGGRFEESVTDAVERFTESISYDKLLYKQDIMGSRAHATMLARQGLMTESDRDSILKGLDQIERSIESGEFVWRADREDVHMNIEAALTDLIGEPAKKLHTARSRNDQVLTDFRLWCRDAIDKILVHIKQLQVALVTLAIKNEGLIVPGYTHLQRAQPVLLQHLLLSYVEQLERDAGRLVDCKNRLNFCPLGACALAGTGLPIDRFMTSEALGFTAPLRNSIDAVSDRDFVLEFLSANSITAIHLSRIGEEWVLWASEEFGFLTPSDSVSTGSSIMPQKKNPDPMELVRGKSARIVGDLVSVLVLCKGLPHAYNRDLQEDKEPLFDSVKTIIGMLEVTAEFAQNITFNRERIQKSLPAGHLDATTLADYLVKKVFDGIFRCYAVAIAVFVVVAETEWGFIFKFWKILEYWTGRGMLQIFVAVMTRAFPDANGARKDLVLLQNIASYLLLACGLTYVVLGALCIGFLKRARQHEKITREQAFKDLEELERRRQELEALLVTERV